jgi:cysteinyl-tRNA synthetase
MRAPLMFFFPSRAFPNYGQLSHCNHEEMIAGARVEVALLQKKSRRFYTLETL